MSRALAARRRRNRIIAGSAILAVIAGVTAGVVYYQRPKTRPYFAAGGIALGVAAKLRELMRVW